MKEIPEEYPRLEPRFYQAFKIPPSKPYDEAETVRKINQLLQTRPDSFLCEIDIIVLDMVKAKCVNLYKMVDFLSNHDGEFTSDHLAVYVEASRLIQKSDKKIE